MYQVWKINDRNVYEKVAETEIVTCAIAIKDYLMCQGMYAQICKEGEMHINAKEVAKV